MNINPNESQSISQSRQILAWLESGKALTSLEALTQFGCMRLASRISDLRKDGIAIKVQRVTTATGKSVAQYSLAV